MLTELCGYLKNWFDRERLYGDFVISDGVITYADGTELPLQEGQYFRIIGSVFNNGIHHLFSQGAGEGETSPDTLVDEAFNGSVWCLAIPKEVVALADDIKAWVDKYGNTDSVAMSPFNSESFVNYSYSKPSGNSANSFQSVFGSRLIRYRKV